MKKWLVVTSVFFALAIYFQNCSRVSISEGTLEKSSLSSTSTGTPGICGNAVGSCSSGSVSSVSNNGTTSTWTCSSNNNGPTATCNFLTQLTEAVAPSLVDVVRARRARPLTMVEQRAGNAQAQMVAPSSCAIHQIR